MNRPEPFTKPITLKVLYTFDDQTSFLARSTKPLNSKIITLPQQPPHHGQQIGCIELKKCISLVQFSSPEWFQKSMDYSIYYKDIMEFNEPYVGFGLCSKVVKDKKNSVITGRISTNFLSLYSGEDANDTLEVKLRFCPLSSTSLKRKAHELHAQSSSSPIEDTVGTSSPMINSDDFSEPLARKKQAKRNNNVSSIPLMASRTQSLPFLSENSLAHRIRLSDMKSNNAVELDARGEPISSRFAILPKSIDDAPPTKAKKTKSFIQSVVKIGDTTLKKSNTNQKCINCSLNNQPPYKYHKEGIFQFGNAGFLCSICTTYQSQNDLKQLRERGTMGATGLLTGPYSKSSRKQKRKNVDSSPALSSSSPLTSGFNQSKKSKSINSKVINNFPMLNPSKNHTPAQDLFDMSNILSLDRDLAFSSSENVDRVNPSTDNDNFEDNFRLPMDRRKSKTKNISPISEFDYDNVPLGATKLNTTLIPQFDEDDKENYAPPKQHINRNKPHTILGTEMSPSIQKIIESFSNNEPSSPTKAENDWNYDFFSAHNEEFNDPEINRILNSHKTPIADVTPKDADTVQTANDDSPNMYRLTPGMNETFPAVPSATEASAALGVDENSIKNGSNSGSSTTNSSAALKNNKVNMPSSPFFSIPENNEDETVDTTNRTMPNWERSSPATDPASMTKECI